MYDVIVVGARVAGASTAMLLARRGLKVLAVDRARFPSDTLSTHQVQVPGVARLRALGAARRGLAAGTPARAARCASIPGRWCCEGRFPEFEGVDALYSPRRTLLDKLLVDAAREAGAEVRERFAVDELRVRRRPGDGIRGRSGGGAVTRDARGSWSAPTGATRAVAKAVGARRLPRQAGAHDRLLHVLVGRRSWAAARCTRRDARGWSARGRRTTGS